MREVLQQAVAPERFKKVPLAEITSPEKSGFLRVIKDHWWAVTSDDCVLIYTHRGSNSPQCNVNRAIVERVLCPQLQTGVKFLPFAYLKIDPRDYA
jgi:hypothetical protein